jgi:hypothetical protein
MLPLLPLLALTTFAVWDGPIALVISLRSAAERRLHITRVFEACNIPFEFVDAFEAKEGNVFHADDFKRIKEAGLEGLLNGTMAAVAYADGQQPDLGSQVGFKTDGELAIALSHAYVLHRIRSGATEQVLVCEDDVAPLVSGKPVGADDALQIALWQETAKSVTGAMPQGWEIFYFGWCLENCHEVKEVSSHAVHARRPLCTHGECFLRVC